MPRTPLPPGEWGAISTHARDDGWAAQARFHDPARGRVVQVRRFGATPEEAAERLGAVLRERAARHPAVMPEVATLGEAVTWWWATERPTLGWSETTERSMRYARRRLDAYATEAWPVSDERAAVLWGDDSRTDALARRLLAAVRG